jgi:hypothetical protein
MKKVLLLMLMLSGCASLDRDYLVGSFCTGVDCYKVLEKHSQSIEGNRSAKIGFIEFNDHGFQKDPQAVDNILENISKMSRDPNASPLLMVIFIHGWHHNASPDDSNVKSFENFLINLQYEEDNVSFSNTKRQVVGVYIGWRGESSESILNPLTYRSRKLAGLRVGQYGLQEVLAELSLVRKDNDRNRLVSIGHSFGGGVLYSSVMQNLVDSVVSADLSGKSGTVDIIDKAYGDLVILMNPALEAARVEILNRRLSEAAEFNACQPLVLASFTSEKDQALSDAFPKGQSIFFGDDIRVAEADGYENLVISSYGNEESFKTHDLKCEHCVYTEEPKFLSKEQYVSAFKGWSDFRSDENHMFTVDNMQLSHHTGSKISPGSPIINVYVMSDNIIADHNAIWGGEFSKFARALIGMEFAKQNKCPTP